MSSKVMNVISNLLKSIADDIDCGNSNLTEDEALKVTEVLRSFIDKTERISKYEACRYLNVSRATFDNYVRAGLLPRGEHHIGFKELSWDKKTLDKFIESQRNHSRNSTTGVVQKSLHKQQ